METRYLFSIKMTPLTCEIHMIWCRFYDQHNAFPKNTPFTCEFYIWSFGAAINVLKLKQAL